jgi:Zn-dependent protease with chaperone function
MQQIAVSENFKKMTVKAIGSIILFIATYILLICLAITLIILCGILGFALVSSTINTATILISVGLVSMGILVLIFLVKFIFKKHITDRSHLTEITASQEPVLFFLIEEIVKEVETDFPKKIYLSADVNASVFYDSNFWSMFLPVKKNLQIGIGLVNTVSVIELKAILAHEFGHFSQRTMTVGSYVYNMNQIIYNMLYDNDAYDKIAEKWGSGHAIIGIFVMLAVKVVKGIQWVLQKIYEIINLSYLSLSREMEFHADEVAAHVAGSRPLIASLLRMDLADYAYNAVLNYYGSRINDSVKSENIYPEQKYVMNFLAEKSYLPFENDLPQVSLDHLSRYNKSKLVVTDQWASHPNTTDRIRQLEKLDIPVKGNDTRPASCLFSNIGSLQDQLTDKLFSLVTYPDAPAVKTREQFVEEFRKELRENSFDDLYNTYYDNKNPSHLDIDKMSAEQSIVSSDSTFFFGDRSLDLVYTLAGLESDLDMLGQIGSGSYPAKSFDYDGTKYTPEDCDQLIAQLAISASQVKEALYNNDVRIYQHALKLAQNQGTEQEIKSQYQAFFDVDKVYVQRLAVCLGMVNDSSFIFQTTPFELIKEKMKVLLETETGFKKEIKCLFHEDPFRQHITEEIKVNFEDYLAYDRTYFYDDVYKNEELNLMFTCVGNYQTVLSKTHFNVKKELLECQAKLFKSDKGVLADQPLHRI